MGIKLLGTGLVVFGLVAARGAEERGLNFDEVFNVIRTNVTDISEGELRARAARGLIEEMGTRVELVRTNAEAAARPADAIPRRSVFEERFGYIRVRSVDERLGEDFGRSLGEMTRSNALKGLIVDLRYAEGTNYESAASVADEFVAAGRPLLRVGGERMVAKTPEAVRLPLAVLVNGETRGAAEAIAGMLREEGSGLVIGSRTKGEAFVFEVFTLSTGQTLRVGTTPVEVGSGKVIPATGVEPDLAVEVDAEEERLFYLDPYRLRRPTTRPADGESAGVGNRARRMNEAELVRRHREGFDFSEQEGEAEGDEIGDPALSRAIDFLKGVSKLEGRRGF